MEIERAVAVPAQGVRAPSLKMSFLLWGLIQVKAPLHNMCLAAILPAHDCQSKDIVFYGDSTRVFSLSFWGNFF